MLSQIDTPCILLEQQKLLRNIKNMQDKAESCQVALRPHLKTSKCADIARLFNGTSGPQSITVSTLREAEYFAEHGYQNILYAVSLEPGKFRRLAKLYRRNVEVIVILDSLEVAQALQEFCAAEGLTVSVMIEVDVDGHRAGVTPEDSRLVTLAEMLSAAKNIYFSGLMTHGGGSYDCHSWSEVEQHAALEQRKILDAAQRCRESGIAIPKISIGSTPTVVAADNFDGIDEIRPGVFVFFDLFQMQLGACHFDDIALSVLCSVVAHKKEQNRIIVDAGGLALSKDRSTAGAAHDMGYGLVADINGVAIQPELLVSEVNQEHGIIDLPTEAKCDDYPVGTRLRIFPNHACMTAAAYEGYVVLQGSSMSQTSLGYWARCNGW